MNLCNALLTDYLLTWKCCYRSKYIIRTVVINIVAVYIAYRITMAFFLEEQDMLKRGIQGGMPAMDPLDAEF